MVPQPCEGAQEELHCFLHSKHEQRGTRTTTIICGVCHSMELSKGAV